MNRTLWPPPSGDDLLSRDENTSRKHWECSNDVIIRGAGDTDLSPNIMTVVITIIGDDVYPVNRDYKGTVLDRMVTPDRNTR